MRLASESDMTVVGEATAGETALALAPVLLPDIVLMDFQMPDIDGIATTKALHTIYPNVAVIMLTIHDNTTTRARAEDADVSAFITKQISMNELLAAIRRTADTVKRESR